MSRNTNKAYLILFFITVLTVALYAFPFGRILAYPFLLISTLAHEMGHGITAWIVGANFNSFTMWENASGVASISGNISRLSHGLIAAGGLIGPAFCAAVLFIVAKNETIARISLSILGVLLIIAEFVVVNSAFTAIFVGILAAIFLWTAQQSRTWIAQGTLVFTALQLTLSVFSRSDYLFTQYARTSQGLMPSDVELMARAWVLPYWFWGTCCGIFSIIILVFGLWRYSRN